MKIKFEFFSLLFLLSSVLFGNTFEIKLDGTGNFTTIQAGIEAVADSDTVLVYPGTYYENLDFLGKSLTLSSLYSFTESDSIINQTIIDGSHQYRCITIDTCENVELIGFTIQNGEVSGGGWHSGTGGGILVKDVENMLLSNCKIKNNIADSSGGVKIYQSNIHLVGNIISHNWGKEVAGGISFVGDLTTVFFSENNLNSFFLNYSATGADIYIAYSIPHIDIIADTLTVLNPDFFFVGPEQQCSISQLNYKIEEIDQDLYVSPYGDDGNSGLTLEEPLQTLAWAQTLIKRNDENPHTIFLAEGTYSPSLNNQLFPLNIKQGITYQGISPENTILDAENETPLFYQFSRYQELAKLILMNLIITNTNFINNHYGSAVSIFQGDLELYNVIIENSNSDFGGAIWTFNGYATLNNVIIRNNNGQRALTFGIEYTSPNPTRQVTITNSKIINNNPSTFDPDFPLGIALDISGHSSIPGDYFAKIINCEISGNLNSGYNPQTGLGGTSAICLDDYINVDIINCTIGGNELAYNTGCSISVENNSTVDIYNTILYDNDGYSFNLFEGAEVNITNSLIEGSNGNINYYYPLAVVSWIDDNLYSNPEFIGENEDYPFYSLEATSPCINAGTLDLPEGIELPEFDLAGNPRIYGDGVDMGAYELQGEPQSTEPDEIIIPKSNRISNYPNPFNPTTNIKLNLSETGIIDFSIYNIKGQKIKTLIDAYSSEGIFEFVWDGNDYNKKQVSSGTYFMKLSVDGVEKAVEKCTLLK